MIRDRLQAWLRQFGAWVLWSRRRAAAAVAVCIATVVALVVVSLTVAARVDAARPEPATTGDKTACRAGAEAWAEAFTATTPDAEWKTRLTQTVTGRIAPMLDAYDRTHIPPGPPVVDSVTVHDSGSCETRVDLGDGQRMLVDLVPSAEGGWVADGWDGGS